MCGWIDEVYDDTFVLYAYVYKIFDKDDMVHVYIRTHLKKTANLVILHKNHPKFRELHRLLQTSDTYKFCCRRVYNNAHTYHIELLNIVV
jgi:hypothetical protein